MARTLQTITLNMLKYVIQSEADMIIGDSHNDTQLLLYVSLFSMIPWRDQDNNVGDMLNIC